MLAMQGATLPIGVTMQPIAGKADSYNHRSQRKRQGDCHLLARGQTHFKIGRIVNQHVHPGKRLGGDQAR